MKNVDPAHLQALLASAGKHIAALPGAKRVVARMRVADSPEDLSYLLQSVDIGLDEPARRLIVAATKDEERWRDAHAALVRSAEMHLTEKFSPSS